jgi:tetratricopeptide (TPR) repeat protein
VSESLAFAKAAVALDADDGASWLQLAMALMALAFASGRTRAADLEPAAKAFAHSAKKRTAQHSADMCFNRGVLLRFLDDVQGALDCFQRAGALDPALPWRARVEHLVRDVAKVHQLVRTRGHLKPKRVAQAAAALLATPPPAASVAVVTQALTDGANAGHCTLGTVLAIASAPGAVPLVAVAVDAAGECFAMSVFGVQDGALREGSTCAVLSPLVTRVQATLPDGLQAAYTLLRVEGAAAVQCWHHGAWTLPQAQREAPSVRFQV